ncbi:MAG: hypothetical protein Kow0089_17600 [Desulfobulbaceae bacterium]
MKRIASSIFRDERRAFPAALLLFLVLSLVSGGKLSADPLDDCFLQALHYADDAVTVGQLREQCREETEGVATDKPGEPAEGKVHSTGPEEIVLKTATSRKPAYFPHKKHQERYDCGTCHHGRTPAGKREEFSENTVIYKCTFCHNSDMPNEKLNGFQLIGHRLCRECHRKHQDITTARCTTCHRKNL